MMKLHFNAKKAILRMRSKGLSCNAIAKELVSECGIQVSSQAISVFLLCYNKRKSLTQRIGSGRPSKITPEMRVIVEAKCKLTTKLLQYNYYGYSEEVEYKQVLPQ